MVFLRIGIMADIGVLGAGTWGMALTRMLSLTGHRVTVWSALPAEIEAYQNTRRQPNLPGMVIPDEVQFTTSIEDVCTGKELLLFVVPSVFVRTTAAAATGPASGPLPASSIPAI